MILYARSIPSIPSIPASQALEKEDAALFSESDVLTESECEVMSDGALSDSTSNKDSRAHTEGKKKDRPSGELNTQVKFSYNLT